MKYIFQSLGKYWKEILSPVSGLSACISTSPVSGLSACISTSPNTILYNEHEHVTGQTRYSHRSVPLSPIYK